MPQSSSTITGDLRLRWEICTILCQWELSSESRAKCCSHKKIMQSPSETGDRLVWKRDGCKTKASTHLVTHTVVFCHSGK